jgi:hypothetical protein
MFRNEASIFTVKCLVDESDTIKNLGYFLNGKQNVRKRSLVYNRAECFEIWLPIRR